MNSLKPLQNCSVLITRPLHQAQSLNEMISSAGGSVILFPTIEIIPAADLEPLHTILQQLKQWNIAIFVSANAVHAVMKYSPQQQFKTLEIVAIGPGTAKILR